MAEDVNPAPKTDPNPAPALGSEDQPVKPGSDSNPTNNDPAPQPESHRKMQSERDKAKAEKQSFEERLAAMEDRDALAARDSAISSFLKKNGDKYKDVEAEDLEFATSPDEIEVLAKRSQAKADRIRNEALKSLKEVPEESLTAEEKAKALANLEKEVKPGESKFGSFLNIQRKKVKS